MITVWLFLTKGSALLVEADGVFLEREDVVGEDDDLVVASLVEADEELACAELVGVHGVKQDPFLGLYSHVLVIKLRGHGTPHLRITRRLMRAHMYVHFCLSCTCTWEVREILNISSCPVIVSPRHTAL